MDASSGDHRVNLAQQVNDVPSPEETLQAARRHVKAEAKLKKRLVGDFSSALEAVAKQQDLVRSHGAAGAVAKERRKALRELVKVVSDASLPLEERMQLLQTRLVGVLQEQLKLDKQVADLQTQLDSEKKEAEAGRAELARTQQKATSLENLARVMGAQNKLLEEEAKQNKQALANVQGFVNEFQERLDEQRTTSLKVLEDNKALAADNAVLKAQLESTKGALEQLQTIQREKLDELAKQLEQQNTAMTQAATMHEAVTALMKENETLKLKAGLTDMLTERGELLEKALKDAQGQIAVYKKQLQQQSESLDNTSKVLKGFDKVRKTVTEQQQGMQLLMQERQLLQQQVQTLQQQSREQGEQLRRVKAQKQRLEGLCRALQARADMVGGSGGPLGLLMSHMRGCAVSVDAAVEADAEAKAGAEAEAGVGAEAEAGAKAEAGAEATATEGAIEGVVEVPTDVAGRAPSPAAAPSSVPDASECGPAPDVAGSDLGCCSDTDAAADAAPAVAAAEEVAAAVEVAAPAEVAAAAAEAAAAPSGDTDLTAAAPEAQAPSAADEEVQVC